jgi:SAM-dependent methyltransferase
VFTFYLDEERMRREVAAGRHRDVIGGLWDEIGALQFDWLARQGLRSDHKFIDIGCGSLRAGVRLIPLLGQNYYGIDVSPALISAAVDEALAVDPDFPPANLAANGDFALDTFDQFFDVGLAQSVFTHLPLSELARCLNTTAPYFKLGARLYATFFRGPPDRPVRQPSGKWSFADRDPYHFDPAAIEATTPPSWEFEWIGDWNHPRDLQMVAFTKL